MTQKKFLSELLKNNPKATIVGSLGNISKDLKDIPHANKVLVKGAMGCAMGVGLGIALNIKDKVIVVIGDGSFLMKMGTMADIQAFNLPNLEVIILNNGCYNSCGGQTTNFKALKDLPFKVYNITT